jgi:pimeloyl-ACP methyl ester carboxylesterase
MTAVVGDVVYLLHGKGGSPEGSVRKLQGELEPHWPAISFIRPLLPHHDPDVPAEASVEALRQMDIPSKALLIGVSLGGLVAAKLQESCRPDLQVIAISAPTWADGVHLEKQHGGRLALYSSRDEVIAGRTENWPKLAESYDLKWLNHDTDTHAAALVRLLIAHVNGDDMTAAIARIGT